jgi:hypothetical protein
MDDTVTSHKDTDLPPRALKVLLIVLSVLALLRVIGFVRAFGDESLQMDFAAFYTAGEALNARLSPYESHILRSPPIWDGVDRFQHSRFLYPPLVATLFRPVAYLSYHTAKIAWMALSLVALVASLGLAMRSTGIGLSETAAWATWLVAFSFHPLLTFLERGQIDSLTLLLLTGGIALLCTRRREGLAGFLIALATLLKLHTVLLLPFLVLRKRWRALIGYAVGGVLLLTLSLILDGPALLVRYATVEFPRISHFGEGGTPEMLVDPAALAALQPGEGLTAKDGRVYQLESFSFVSNATLGRTRTGRSLQALLVISGIPSAQSVTALVFFSALFGAVVLLQRRAGLADGSSPQRDFLYWQLGLVIVLLSAPLTWVMNAIWLLTLVPLTARELARRQPWHRSLAPVLVALGLVVAALPDHVTFSLLLPARYIGEAAWQKYVIAQLAVALGLMGWLSSERADPLRPPHDAKPPVGPA